MKTPASLIRPQDERNGTTNDPLGFTHHDACKMHLILGLTIGLDERASINKEPTS